MLQFYKMLLRLKDLSYRERLGRLALYSLVHRRLKFDLIEMYKIMRGRDRMNVQSFTEVEEYKNRGHRFKLRVARFNRNLRGNVSLRGVYRTSCQRRYLRQVR